MLYLIALFISPLALLLAVKPFQAVINFVIYVFAFIGLFVFIFPGIILWAIGVIHAFAVISSKNADQRAQKIVDAIRREQNG